MPDQSFTLGQTASFTVGALDPNPGQTVTFSLEGGNTSRLSIDAKTGIVTVKTASTDAPATLTVVVQATDSAAVPLTSSWSFKVSLLAPPNRPPVLDSIADQTVTAGTLLTFTAHATDPDSGQTLAYSLTAPLSSARRSTAPRASSLTARPPT